MKHDIVSYVLSEEDFTALKQKITELEVKVSEWAIELHIDNKRAIGILGDRSLPFTEHAFMLATERKDFVPDYINMEEFKKDLELFKKCKELVKLLEIVYERVTDTYIAAGSDALSTARKFYSHIKSLVRANIPGSNVVYEELKKRYRKTTEKEESNVEEKNTNEKKNTDTQSKQSN